MTGDAVPARERIRPYLGVLRAHRPGLAGWLDRLRFGVRTPPAAAAELVRLRSTVLDLQRDQRLLAAHVAALTGRLEEAAARPAGESDEARDRAVQAARLSAVAFYEHRIARLERALPRARRAAPSVDHDG